MASKKPKPPTPQELSRQYLGQSNRLTDEVAGYAKKRFLEIGGVDDAAVAKFLKNVLPLVAAGTVQMSTLTRGYYATLATILGQEFNPRRMPRNLLNPSELRGGAVTAAEIYTRGFVTARIALGDGKPLDTALNLGAARIYNIARTDMQLAKTQTGLFVRGGNSNIVGYARVLSGSENCGLCYVASTQRYNVKDLLPIHPGCDCGEMPIYGNRDPGQVIDEANLEATHEAVAKRFGASARNARDIDYRLITIEQHGEIGPLLTVKGHKFTGPSDI
jgi:hypothetical protein